MEIPRMNSDVQIMLVPQAMVGSMKPIVEGLLNGKEFSSPVLYSIDQMFDRLSEGKMQLWLAGDSGELPFLFMVTEIAEYPAAKTARICMIAGSRLRDVLFFAPKFELWCRMQGALYSEATVPPKLSTVLARYGFKATALAVWKPLMTVQ